MRSAVVVFPGSNRDRDMIAALTKISGSAPELVWHQDTVIPDVDLIVVPGGFSYGDYLRCGAIARFSPVIQAVKGFAAGGGLVMGFCNGFQILTEAGMLPGALLRNQGLKFICKPVDLIVATTNSPFTHLADKGQTLRIPIAHGEGNYFATPEVLAKLEANRQVIFRYTTAQGDVTDEANPNGSLAGIAGLCNEARNVVGLMPHPERACELAVNGADGLVMLQSAVQWFARRAPAAVAVRGAGSLGA